jgi:hypothetical protein
MPEAMERRLKAQAKRKGFGKERADRYTYGTMRKAGWKPKRERYVESLLKDNR